MKFLIVLTFFVIVASVNGASVVTDQEETTKRNCGTCDYSYNQICIMANHIDIPYSFWNECELKKYQCEHPELRKN